MGAIPLGMNAAPVFELDASLFKGPLSLLKRPIEKLLSLEALERLYRVIRDSGDDFLESALDIMDVRVEVAAEDLARIPKNGPLMVVANHPFGGIEGLVLGAILRRVRPDVRVMANFMLGRIPEMRDLIIPVDPFAGTDATARNVGPLRESMRWLEQGAALGVFPAGEVSHLTPALRVEDPAWSPTIARIARKRGVPVLPVYFEGENGPLFQIAGLLHPRLRTALLPRELANFTNREVRVRIGKVISPASFDAYESDRELVEYLRLRTYLLGSRPSPEGPKPIAQAGDPGPMVEEVARLAGTQLLGSGDLAVYAARADAIPSVLHEIGRLREITFRAAQEGTGNSIDLDRFDADYVHLFVWNHATHEVVGAYRIGHTDEILERHGVSGLYTHTLFAYDDELLRRVGPALELGRSFVRPEYQRAYAPLLLLWRGIGQYVARHPRYRTLFGPVSINSAYSSVSRELIATFLQANETIPELARLVRPRTPLKPRRSGLDVRKTSRALKDLDQVSELVSELEADAKGIPVLLKQYMKLGGKLLAFNVDPDFGDVLDGLILVNLDQTDSRILDKYMGRDQAASFVRREVPSRLALVG